MTVVMVELLLGEEGIWQIFVIVLTLTVVSPREAVAVGEEECPP